MPSTIYNLEGKRVWIAGHQGMVGSAIYRRLSSENCEILCASHNELDLNCQVAVNEWVHEHRPEVVIIAAAKVGGIYANINYPVDFLYNNLMIETNIIHAAWKMEIEKLLFLGSSCIYPRECPKPIKEEYLLTGPLEPTNQWYAIAKISGIKLCQAYRRQYGCDFISAMPTNLYGPGDNFDKKNSHVPAALLRRFHEAKISSQTEVVVWGSGRPRREFLYVDDLADACIFLLECYSGEPHINVGTGKEITITEFAETIRHVTGFTGKLKFDQSQPDGMPRKVLDVSRINSMGWKASTSLKEGLHRYYKWYVGNFDKIRD